MNAAISVTELDLDGAILIYKPTNTLIRKYAIPLDDYFADPRWFADERLGPAFYAYPIPNDGLERMFPSHYTPRTVRDETGELLVQPIRFQTDGLTKSACWRLGDELVNGDDITFYTVPKYHLHLSRAVAKFNVAHPNSTLRQPHYTHHCYVELDDGFHDIVMGQSRLATITKREKSYDKWTLPHMVAFSRIEIRCPDGIDSTSAEWTVSVIARDIWSKEEPQSDTLVGIVDSGRTESPRTIGNAIYSGEFSAFDTALILATTVRDNANTEMSQMVSEFARKLEADVPHSSSYRSRQSTRLLPDRPITTYGTCIPYTVNLPRDVLEHVYAMYDSPEYDDWADPYDI